MASTEDLMAKARRLGIPEILIASATLDGVLDALVFDAVEAGESPAIAARNKAARKARRKYGENRWAEMTSEERAAAEDNEMCVLDLCEWDALQEESDEL